jgi:hypothetical protein
VLILCSRFGYVAILAIVVTIIINNLHHVNRVRGIKSTPRNQNRTDNKAIKREPSIGSLCFLLNYARTMRVFFVAREQTRAVPALRALTPLRHRAAENRQGPEAISIAELWQRWSVSRSEINAVCVPS